MGKDPINENTNVYFQARKKAAIYNERLYSREGAAELLGISVSTLADYELGNTKVVPVDKVVLMAELYNCPELKTSYCKNECPIGKTMPLATRITSIEGMALRMVRELDLDEIKQMKKSLIDIAADGIISEEEKPELRNIMIKLNELSVVISEIRLIGEKVLKG
ncbi:MAG: helix-turn-helix domain-containing protein [Lachnospiraceae bacterium]|jgi:transcriptional regulator with XRE-family HTH domain|nr:helix-turn-helix domain-containing protein [Lachnospiraceae bacterium]